MKTNCMTVEYSSVSTTWMTSISIVSDKLCSVVYTISARVALVRAYLVVAVSDVFLS